MWITILETFKEGTEKFNRGEVRCVPDEFGAAVIAAGWAGDTNDKSIYLVMPEVSAPESITLQIHSGAQRVSDSLRG